MNLIQKIIKTSEMQAWIDMYIFVYDFMTTQVNRMLCLGVCI